MQVCDHSSDPLRCSGWAALHFLGVGMEACNVLLENRDLLMAGLSVAYVGLEYWLGKTDKVEAASALELILSPFFKKQKSLEDK